MRLTLPSRRVLNRTVRRFACTAVLLAPLMAPAVIWANGLQSLALHVTGGSTLEPAFEPGTTRYRSQVQSDIGTLVVEARPVAAGAVVNLFVDGRPVDPKTPTQAPLAVGSNLVEIRIADAAGQALGSYQITVERENLQPVVDRFQKKSFADVTNGRTMPYRLFVPEGAGSGKPLPLVVFLHGGGERGDDNEKTLTANQGGTVWAKPQEQARRPAYVLVPQARAVWNGGFGQTRNADNKLDLTHALKPAEDLLTVQRLLRQVLADHPGIDRKRLYLTGISQGGLGTWAWNVLEPDLFAAMVPVCGGGDPAQVATLKNKPLWAFHAAADPVVPADLTRQAIAALKAAGGQPRYTEFDSSTFFFPMAHFAWVPTYQNDAMRAWLFEQSR